MLTTCIVHASTHTQKFLTFNFNKFSCNQSVPIAGTNHTRTRCNKLHKII